MFPASMLHPHMLGAFTESENKIPKKKKHKNTLVQADICGIEKV